MRGFSLCSGVVRESLQIIHNADYVNRLKVLDTMMGPEWRSANLDSHSVLLSSLWLGEALNFLTSWFSIKLTVGFG